jgi:hypothetical protein
MRTYHCPTLTFLTCSPEWRHRMLFAANDSLDLEVAKRTGKYPKSACSHCIQQHSSDSLEGK